MKDNYNPDMSILSRIEVGAKVRYVKFGNHDEPIFLTGIINEIILCPWQTDLAINDDLCHTLCIGKIGIDGETRCRCWSGDGKSYTHIIGIVDEDFLTEEDMML